MSLALASLGIGFGAVGLLFGACLATEWWEKRGQRLTRFQGRLLGFLLLGLLLSAAVYLNVAP